MKIDIFRSGSGDCLLLTSPGGRRILADGAIPPAFSEHVAKPLGRLRNAGTTIDVAYVSHIDRDHIGGILRLLDLETQWRVYHHMIAKGRSWRKPDLPRPPEIAAIWHNAFFDDVAKTRDLSLNLADVGAVLGDTAAAAASQQNLQAAAYANLLALSVGDAIEVNWRIGDRQLAIPLNPPTGGALMLRETVPEPIVVGDMRCTVVSPSRESMRELKTIWIAWLKKSQSYLQRLRKSHDKDIDRLRSANSESMTLAVETDVTAPNLASFVLLVETDDRRILLSGDAGDETILKDLEDSGLIAAEGTIDLDVLKVPHHGAHNSYSDEFARRVRARHYVFCGDGEHDNPEPDVVRGYLKTLRNRADDDPRRTVRLWFNCSTDVAEPKHREHWQMLETIVAEAAAVDPRLRYRFLQRGDSMRLSLR